jgi:two-component system sensor kinase FixL
MDERGENSRELLILLGALENTTEAFVTIDQNHRVLFFNRAAEKMLGYTRAEVIGQDLNLILTPVCSRDHRKAVKRYLASGTARAIEHETEVSITRKNGETFPASISFSVAHLEGRAFFTAILRDLAETNLLKEQVAKAERLAALGQIVAEITHDIKNPLLIMGAYTRQVVRKTRDKRSLQKLELIAEEVKRLESLLSEINEYYLLRTSRFEEFDLHDLLRGICALAKHDCKEKNVELKCRTGKGPAWVEGDRDKWKRVFLNLIRNAVEALQDGGSLSFQSARMGGQIHVSVRDNGPGIPEKIQKEIFTPFFTTKEKGTGLGLPICKRIVESHPGSSIEVQSREGEGTEVRVTIPTYRAAVRKSR